LRVGVAPGCRAGLSLAGPVAFDELVEIRSPERIGLEREELVRPQVVDPQPLRPWPLGARLLVKEEDVRLDTLGVEDAGGEPDQGVHVALIEELATDRLAGAPLE